MQFCDTKFFGYSPLRGAREHICHTYIFRVYWIGGAVVCLMPTKDSPNQITALTATSVMFEMICMVAENVSGK